MNWSITKLISFVCVLMLMVVFVGCATTPSTTHTKTSEKEVKDVILAETLTLYDDFNSGSIPYDLWKKRLQGLESNVDIKNGVVIAATANDLTIGTGGKAGLNFIKEKSFNGPSVLNPDFQGFQADVKIIESTGKAWNLIRLEGNAYNTGIRIADNYQGEIYIDLALLPSGSVRYVIGIWKAEGFSSYKVARITSAEIGLVDPHTTHTLFMGFDGNNALFRLDDNDLITVNIIDQYPVGTSGWRYASIRARSMGREAGSIVAEIDNVKNWLK